LKHAEMASFIERPNRFTLVCRLNGKDVKAFLPNPGRLWELLLPEAAVYLETSQSPTSKMPYVAVAIQKEDHPVMVHTHRTNDLANYLIQNALVPGLEGSEVIKREVTRGRSRFDFLLRKGKTEIVLEVKSCTLFGKRIAMFPDAVTSRGKRHIEELAALPKSGTTGAVLFLIYWPQAEFFVPEYHTDLEFTRALLASREKISLIPLAVELREDLSLTSRVRILKVPWNIVEKEAEDRGSYILILRLPQEVRKGIGNIGEVRFREGYYLYVGSARRNLSKRIERHRRIRKRHFWHIDFLRATAEFHSALPIRTENLIECEIARAVKGIAEWEIPRFGSSDCSCSSHLHGMSHDPLKSAKFIALLQYFRMDRLIGG
jgi:sugar fermentation stimulation protein A